MRKRRNAVAEACEEVGRAKQLRGVVVSSVEREISSDSIAESDPTIDLFDIDLLRSKLPDDVTIAYVDRFRN